jgi:carbamoyl-phosphate synthase large subunit
VFAADVRPELSVACHLAHDSFAVPSIEDAGYVSQLMDLCTAHEIGLIVPTIDPELPVLARWRQAFAERGTALIVSSEDFVRIARDKRATAQWFVSQGLRVPQRVDPRAANRFPIFARPYDGSSSRNICVINDASQVTSALLEDSQLIFTEYLSPREYDEYTIDMYFTTAGALRCIVPRLRIETRAGEVSKSRTTRLDAFELVRERLATVAGARGCITMQVFVHRRSAKVYAIEINARFGGGYPLSYEAGANFPRWLIQEYLLGKTVEFFDGWESDLTMLRYDEHVLVRRDAA